MAELNLKQILDRLNTEFTGETRKLVFWYDDNTGLELFRHPVMMDLTFADDFNW